MTEILHRNIIQITSEKLCEILMKQSKLSSWCTKIKVLIVLFAIHSVVVAENMNEPFELSKVKVTSIQDSQNNRQYELYIKLPENYSKDTEKKYPVLYYTDALWHFEILSASTEYMLEDVILVGISWQKDLKDKPGKLGFHASRYRDYSIQQSSNSEAQTKYQFGQANNHLSFIRNDVIQYIENNYRADPKSRTYFGYSLGGQFGAYILLAQPDTFNNYILGSPSIKSELPYLSELNSKFGPFDNLNRSTSLNANVFISHGSLEEKKPIEEFIKLLNDRLDDGLSVQKEVIDGTHKTAFPMSAVRSVAWLSNSIREITSSNTELDFFEIPQLNKAFINTSPEDRNDGLVVGNLGVDGGNKDILVKLAQEIADHKHGRLDSMLIAHKGKLIFESYYARGRINVPNGQASATKAYTSILLGRAIQLGYLTIADLDKPLVSFLKDLDPSTFVAGAEKITLKQALTMQTGIRISEEQREAMNSNPEQLKGQGQVQAMLERSAPITEESQVFKYGTGPELVMQVIETVVPGSAMDFIKNEFLSKLGISNYRWRVDKNSGLPRSGMLVDIRPRDMIKFGSLIMNDGKWNGEQLIPQAYIDKALSHIVSLDDDKVFNGGKDVSNVGFGYLFWNGDLKSGNKRYYSSSAQGGYGQFIIFIKELDLLVVFSAHDNVTEFMQITAERVIPAFAR